jgi:uncharacterized protein (DUF983 family)
VLAVGAVLRCPCCVGGYQYVGFHVLRRGSPICGCAYHVGVTNVAMGKLTAGVAISVLRDSV